MCEVRTQKERRIVRATGRDNKKGQYIDDAQTLFSLDDADGCREMKCQRVS